MTLSLFPLSPPPPYYSETLPEELCQAAEALNFQGNTEAFIKELTDREKRVLYTFPTDCILTEIKRYKKIF